MFSVKNLTGRLLEICLAAPFPDREVDDFVAETRRGVLALLQHHPNLVVCVDCRRLTVLSQEASTKVLEMMKVDSPKILRGAYLVDQASFGIQMQRMIRSSGSPHRRCVTTVDEAVAWLATSLNERERSRLTHFLNGG